jgi:predicted RNase H-like nuclease (RuvC/YqgF family)
LLVDFEYPRWYSWIMQEKVEFLRTEGEEMRRREAAYVESCQRDYELRLQSAMASVSHLPQEIDSLKAVIELKNNELHELRHQNMELQREVCYQILKTVVTNALSSNC